uniref:B30.2/SPRY domain-containing protein n=2 Tax=Macrostomum lignano TaxID=282301 RepID=A0A1I8IT98_9PLAT
AAATASRYYPAQSTPQDYQHQQHQHSTLPAREQFDRRIELESVRPRRWCLTPLDADVDGAGASVAIADQTVDGDETRRPPLLTAACPGGDWLGVRADSGVRNGGQWYFEVVVDVPDGANRDADVDARIGWATASAGLRLGAADGHGFGFGAGPDGRQATKCLAGQVEDYGCRLRPGDVVGAALDLDSGLALFSVNGAEQGQAYSLNRDLRAETFFPAGCARNGANLRWNFGDDPAQPLRHLPGGPWRPAGLAPVNQRTDNPRAWRLNHHDVTGPGLALGPDGASAQGRLGFGWQGVRAAKGVRAVAGGPGRFYYEAEPLESQPAALARVGWATESGSLDAGRDSQGWAYGADPDGFGLAGSQGKKMHSDQIDVYGEPYSGGDVIGCYLDFGAGAIAFAKNGKSFGQAYALPPAARGDSTTYYPVVCLRDQTVDVNFGQRPFRHPPGPGWTPVGLAGDESVRRSARTGVADRKSKGFAYADPRMLQESLSKRKSRLSQASNEDQPRSGAEHGSHEHHRGVQHHRGARGGFLESGEPTVSVRETRTEQSGDEDYCLYDDSLAKPTAIPTVPMDCCARDSYPSHHHHLDLQPTEKTYVTHSEEIGEPEEEVMTFTDEHGSRITKKVVRRRQVRKVITNKVVESHATHGPPCFDTHSGGGGEGAGDGGGPLLERTINGVPEVRRETRITRRNLVISGEGEDE